MKTNASLAFQKYLQKLEGSTQKHYVRYHITKVNFQKQFKIFEIFMINPSLFPDIDDLPSNSILDSLNFITITVADVYEALN